MPSGTKSFAGDENDFTVTATALDQDFDIRFAYVADVDPTISWTAGTRTLTVAFQPGITTVQSIVDAINDADIPLDATMNDETVVAPVTLVGGTGTLSAFDLAQTISVSNLDGSVQASTGTIFMHGYDNDFVVAANAVGAMNFDVQFADGTLDVDWNDTAVPPTLTLTYQSDTTTAAELVQAINDAGVPFVADLVRDLPMLVRFDAAPENDGKGTIAANGLVLATTYRTKGGSGNSASGTKAAIDTVTPAGDDNDFDIVALNNGPANNGKQVSFYELDALWPNPVEATWAGDALTIHYKPGVATVNQIAAKVNGIAGNPFEMVVVTGDSGDGTMRRRRPGTRPGLYDRRWQQRRSGYDGHH